MRDHCQRTTVPRIEGEALGTVQTVIPAEGSPQIRGTVVELRIAMPLAIEESEPAADVAPQDTATQDTATQDTGTETGDDSWIGYWRLGGQIGSNPLDACMVIGRVDGKLSLELDNRKDGALEKSMTLVMRADEHNVMRVHPDVIREFTDSGSSAEGTDGMFDEVGAEIIKTFREVFESLEISRVGADCSMYVYSEDDGAHTVPFSCVREEPGRQ